MTLGRILCLIGLHPLWTNIYGPDDNIYTCVRCRRKRWIDQ